MKKVIKRIIGSVMCCICMLSSVNVHVLGNTFTQNEMSILNFEKIDELYEQQVKALMEQKWQEYEDIADDLQRMGCEEVTYREVLSLIGSNEKHEMMQTYGTSLSNISFSKAASTVSYNGKKYKVMKITATPSGEGYLYQTGATVQTSKNRVKAGSLSLINTVVSGMSNYVGISVSLYNAAKDFVSSISATTEVTNVKANYTWAVAETISFIYVYDASCKNYVLAARYNKVQHDVGVSVPVLKCSKGTFNSKIQQKNYSNTKQCPNYGSSTKAISYFIDGKVYSPYLSSVKINGVEKRIKTISLKIPESAGHMGYGW